MKPVISVLMRRARRQSSDRRFGFGFGVGVGYCLAAAVLKKQKAADESSIR